MPSFPCNIITLSVNDLDAVDGLMKRNSKTLGFLTGETLRQFLSRETVFGAVSQSVVVGYLCFASYANRYRIVHLCVSEDHRGLGIARKLVDRLVNNATTQCLVELNCRRDFPANELWPMLDFIPVAEKPAKSGKGRTLTKWQRRLGDPSQLELFREKLSDKAASVVMDAQIVYHLSAELSTETAPSQALLSDFLVDEIELCVTDEIFKEIDRKDDPLVRQRSRRTAQTYRTIVHDPGRASFYASILRQMLPDTSPADHSDIEHLAKAAASPENTFVTRDARLLANAGDIEAKIGVRVVSPEVLIGQFHALADPRAHRPSFVSGVQFSWHRDRGRQPQGDRRGARGATKSGPRALTHWLLQYVSHPETFRCETLESPAGRVGMRVWETHADGVVFHFIRRARLGASLAAQVEEFLAADTLALAVTQEVDVVSIIAAGLDPRVAPHLERMCFKHVGDSFVRPCMQRAVSVDEGNGLVNRSVPHIGTLYHNVPHDVLSRLWSPAYLDDCAHQNVLVPIKPAYDLSLLDRLAASEDLFGGKAHVLMRWENVYYRKCSHRNLLAPPARIFWYVSGRKGGIVATSLLDRTEVDAAKVLFRRHSRAGTLEWQDIYKLCAGDPMQKIMVLVFSHTFAFRKRISLEQLRAIESRRAVPLQSPRRLSGDVAEAVFATGFGHA